MRFFRILASVICLLAAASAAEIKIKVVDPQSAVVAGAQVVLMLRGSTTPAAVGITSGEGLVVFRERRIRTLSSSCSCSRFCRENSRCFAVSRNASRSNWGWRRPRKVWW